MNWFDRKDDSRKGRTKDGGQGSCRYGACKREEEKEKRLRSKRRPGGERRREIRKERLYADLGGGGCQIKYSELIDEAGRMGNMGE